MEQKEDTQLKLKYFEILGDSELNNIEERHSLIREMFLRNPENEDVVEAYAEFSSDILKDDNISLFLWSKLSEIDPENYVYFAKIGDVAYSLNLYNMSLNSYEKANELSEKKESWILSNTGNLLNSRGFYSLAKKYFDDALEINPKSSYSLQRLADISSNKEKEDEEKKKCLKKGQVEIYSFLSL